MEPSFEKAREVLDAIDKVCVWCAYIPEDETGIDPCEGCMVIKTADDMWRVIDGNTTKQSDERRPNGRRS